MKNLGKFVGGGINKKTAARPQNRAAAPVLTDQARTSAGAQRIIPRPPQPFDNPRGPVNIAAPTSPAYRAPKSLSAFARSTVDRFSKVPIATMSAPNFSAVGYSKGPYSSQRGLHSVNSGYPTKPARVLGSGSQPQAKASGMPKLSAKQRAQYPSLTRAWRP